ncbi:Gfo/Idh/MocA family protein [Halogeometricum limi]|uniref:Predicted dehydrogenase n=1 Tax=Halogeometricum limi TaxID=555875 RepID=A0A1I6IBY0_9EURY|nr:Gfo/Idh/MocA family oxidoreductase [Halogeometricum limi]SFR64124.1 Predicted dehydrogenase [Halogeometricum limi]
MQRVGLVGSGFMATTHATSYQEIADAEVVAVASLSDDREAFAAEHTPDADVYGDAEEMMDDADVTMVDVCTPTPTHRSLVEAAAERGLDAFCEKPLARTVADADAIVDAVEDAGITFMTGHVLRYFPEYVEAKRRIDAGEIGTLGTLHTERLSAPPRYGTNSWFGDKDQSGGVLLDMAIHDFDYLRWVVGEVNRVFARTAEWDDGHLNQHSSVLLRFEDGTTGHVEASWGYPDGSPFVTSYELAGDGGLLEFDARDENAVRVSGGAEGANAPSSPLAKSPYTQELEHFVDCVETGRDPDITPDDARAAVRIALAAIASSERGEPVSPAEVGT